MYRDPRRFYASELQRSLSRRAVERLRQKNRRPEKQSRYKLAA
jgi:hypothetical protein